MEKFRPAGKNFVLLFTFSCLFLLFPFQSFAAKTYQITRVNIDSQLHPNGSMDISESRTFQFNGSFSFVFRTLPSSAPVTFGDFRVSENGKMYRRSESQEPGTYRVTQSSDGIEVRWFFRANNESRTFDFFYRVKDVIQRYKDSSVLYYKFISEEWDHPSGYVQLRVRPPVPVSKNRINEWLHAPLWAESRIEDDGTILGWCENLPAFQYFEIRALYPSEFFSETAEQPGYIRSKIMGAEARWAEEANRQREVARQKIEAREERESQGKWIVIFLSTFGLFVTWSIYKKYGKRPDLPPPVQFSSEIPERTAPALVGYLLGNREVYGRAMVSTMLDLARRGFLALREEQVEKKKLLGGIRFVPEYFWDLKREFWRKNISELKPFEYDLIAFIFDQLTSGTDSISLKEIKKKQSKFQKFFQQWKKDVKKVGEQKGWYDKLSIRGMYYVLGIGVLMLLLTGAAAYFFGIWAVILGVSAAVVFVSSFLIPHRTREGEMIAREWRGLRRYLKKYHYRAESRSALLPRIDDYFVYGLVLGVGQNIFKELVGFIPAEAHHTYIPWYIYHGTGTGTFTPDAFASAFSSMIATTTSAMSTASGAGGGASGGGGGGASSGGGGAG
jgi:uncharacterized membrane protein